MGYDNHNAIRNIGSIIYFLALNWLLLLIAIVSYTTRFCCPRLNSFMPRVSGLIMGIYMLFFEGYIELCLSCFLSLKGGITLNADDKFSYRLSQSIPVVLLVVIPCILLYVLSKSDEELKSKKFHDKYKEIFPNLRLDSHHGLAYNLNYIFRRLILIFICFNPFLT